LDDAIIKEILSLPSDSEHFALQWDSGFLDYAKELLANYTPFLKPDPEYWYTTFCEKA
jgi:hypothetical protein